MQAKLSERQKLIGNINQEISAINRNIQYSAEEIAGLRENLEMLKVRYAQSVRYAYKHRASYNMMAFLFSSNDFNEAIRRLKYLKKYRDYRKDQADQIRLTHRKIEEKINVLNSEKSQKDMLRVAEEQQRLAVQREANETNKVVSELKGKEKDLSNTIAKNQRSLKQLERTIQNLIQREIELARKKAEEEERKRKEEESRRMMAAAGSDRGAGGISVTGTTVKPSVDNNTGGRTAAAPAPANAPPKPVAAAPTTKPSYSLSLTPEATALSNDFESNRGKLPWPVEKGFIAEKFGVNQHPVYQIKTENSGIEIQTAPNAPARAIFNGVVKNVFYVPGMGQCVLVDHGRFFTVYSRLGSVQVNKGQTVAMKQTIGNVVANENGEYLMHFELWKVGANDKSAAQNPEIWIAR